MSRLTTQNADEKIKPYYHAARACHNEGFAAWIEEDDKGLILIVRRLITTAKSPKGEYRNVTVKSVNAERLESRGSPGKDFTVKKMRENNE